MSITFETKCWEKDWKYILKDGYLEKMIKNCDYSFDKKILYINNVKDLDKVKLHAQKKIDKGIIDKYIVVDDYATEALEFFQIKKEDFKGGYYYSIAELVGIYLCETDLLLHFSSDACLVKDNKKWVSNAARLLQESDEYFTANALWDYLYQGAKDESFRETENNFIGFGFSDQCYMFRTIDVKKPIYNEYNVASNRYPKYGGELFEKRVDSYMRNHNLARLTSKETVYTHINFEDRIFIARIINKVKAKIKKKREKRRRKRERILKERGKR